MKLAIGSRWTRGVPVAASLLLGLGLAIGYGTRPDACAAITVFPVWVWLVPGLLLAVLGMRRRSGRKNWLLPGLWLLFLLAMADEPRSLCRAIPWPAALSWESRPDGEAVRVISLNCAIGNRLAAGEVARYRPDIVLLQESPNRAEVEGLARRLFGDEAGFVHGVDASLIARGRVVPANLPANLRGIVVQARVTLASGRDIEVISTRLLPAVFRLDLWSPDCWREQADNRRARREQLRAINRRIASVSVPVILGGDFNAPQGDAVFRLLSPKLHDAFAQGGRGWGNTITDGFPALRIDQIWVSDAFHARSVVARKTEHSDHRMVICDLMLGGRGAKPKQK
ncbi:MAG: Metal-dependent hydrolase, endonuclease/exonuclease/phosphatase family [Planctomycetota bacterium]|nr:Metal-dependent hydrolase, endonuclease/exonuclease/phosphatase family [Planctomycetota bacterium]